MKIHQGVQPRFMHFPVYKWTSAKQIKTLNKYFFDEGTKREKKEERRKEGGRREGGSKKGRGEGEKEGNN